MIYAKNKRWKEKLLRNLCQSGVELTFFPGCMAGIKIGSEDRGSAICRWREA